MFCIGTNSPCCWAPCFDDETALCVSRSHDFLYDTVPPDTPTPSTPAIVSTFAWLPDSRTR